MMNEKRKTIRAVLWDMDGVLIDSESGYFYSVGDMVRSLGYPYGEKEFAKVTGSSYKNIAETLALPEPPEKIRTLYIEALMRSVRENVDSLIDGVSDFLNRFQVMGIKMAIGSSSPQQLVEFAIEKFDLKKWLSVIVTGNDAENGKPSPEIYLKCATQLGVEPEECLVFEDSVNGVLSGKNAGMLVCAYMGTNHHDLDLSNADIAINEFTDATFDEIVALMNPQEK